MQGSENNNIIRYLNALTEIENRRLNLRGNSDKLINDQLDALLNDDSVTPDQRLSVVNAAFAAATQKNRASDVLPMIVRNIKKIADTGQLGQHIDDFQYFVLTAARTLTFRPRAKEAYEIHKLEFFLRLIRFIRNLSEDQQKTIIFAEDSQLLRTLVSYVYLDTPNGIEAYGEAYGEVLKIVAQHREKWQREIAHTIAISSERNLVAGIVSKHFKSGRWLTVLVSGVEPRRIENTGQQEEKQEEKKQTTQVENKQSDQAQVARDQKLIEKLRFTVSGYKHHYRHYLYKSALNTKTLSREHMAQVVEAGDDVMWKVGMDSEHAFTLWSVFKAYYRLTLESSFDPRELTAHRLNYISRDCLGRGLRRAVLYVELLMSLAFSAKPGAYLDKVVDLMGGLQFYVSNFHGTELIHYTEAVFDMLLAHMIGNKGYIRQQFLEEAVKPFITVFKERISEITGRDTREKLGLVYEKFKSWLNEDEQRYLDSSEMSLPRMWESSSDVHHRSPVALAQPKLPGTNIPGSSLRDLPGYRLNMSQHQQLRELLDSPNRFAQERMIQLLDEMMRSQGVAQGAAAGKETLILVADVYASIANENAKELTTKLIAFLEQQNRADVNEIFDTPYLSSLSPDVLKQILPYIMHVNENTDITVYEKEEKQEEEKEQKQDDEPHDSDKNYMTRQKPYAYGVMRNIVPRVFAGIQSEHDCKPALQLLFMVTNHYCNDQASIEANKDSVIAMWQQSLTIFMEKLKHADAEDEYVNIDELMMPLFYMAEHVAHMTQSIEMFNVSQVCFNRIFQLAEKSKHMLLVVCRAMAAAYGYHDENSEVYVRTKLSQALHSGRADHDELDRMIKYAEIHLITMQHGFYSLKKRLQSQKQHRATNKPIKQEIQEYVYNKIENLEVVDREIMKKFAKNLRNFDDFQTTDTIDIYFSTALIMFIQELNHNPNSHEYFSECHKDLIIKVWEMPQDNDALRISVLKHFVGILSVNDNVANNYKYEGVRGAICKFRLRLEKHEGSIDYVRAMIHFHGSWLKFESCQDRRGIVLNDLSKYLLRNLARSDLDKNEILEALCDVLRFFSEEEAERFFTEKNEHGEDIYASLRRRNDSEYYECSSFKHFMAMKVYPEVPYANEVFEQMPISAQAQYKAILALPRFQPKISHTIDEFIEKMQAQHTFSLYRWAGEFCYSIEQLFGPMVLETGRFEFEKFKTVVKLLSDIEFSYDPPEFFDNSNIMMEAEKFLNMFLSVIRIIMRLDTEQQQELLHGHDLKLLACIKQFNPSAIDNKDKKRTELLCHRYEHVMCLIDGNLPEKSSVFSDKSFDVDYDSGKELDPYGYFEGVFDGGDSGHVAAQHSGMTNRSPVALAQPKLPGNNNAAQELKPLGYKAEEESDNDADSVASSDAESVASLSDNLMVMYQRSGSGDGGLPCNLDNNNL